MTLPAEKTLLILDGTGIPLFSARGLTQTLTPISQSAQIQRSVNGGVIDLGSSAFQKYSSKITCTDQRVPVTDNIWPGKVVVISCVAELCYHTGGSPSRPVVLGSSRTEGDFVFYRPVLTMVLMEPINITVNEYTADVSWDMAYEEVGA